MRGPWILAQALFWSVTAPPAALAQASTAMLPVSAEGVTLDELPALEGLDGALRAALSSERDLVLQPKSTTFAHLSSARELGLACRFTDTVCLGKLAILAEVDQLVITAATTTTSGFEVRVAMVDLTGNRAEVTGALPAADPWLDEAAQEIVHRLLSTPGGTTLGEGPRDPGLVEGAEALPATEPAPAVQAGASARAPDTIPAPADPPVEEGGPWLVVGIAAGAAAGLLLLGAAAGGVAMLAFSPAPSGPAVIVLQ